MAFDTQVHRYNKQGKLVETNHYRLIITNGERKFERPPGSGIFYAENGERLTPVAPEAPEPIAGAVVVPEAAVAAKPAVVVGKKA